jgi:hypothetical protein
LYIYLPQLSQMKRPRPLLWSIVILVFLSAGCKKSTVQPRTELSKLPPATQTAQRTFGCLVDGKAFVVKNRSILQGPDIQMNYEFTAGGYYFSISGSNKNPDGSVTSVYLHADSLAVSEGQTLKLIGTLPGQASARYAMLGSVFHQFYTSSASTGELTITKLDAVRGIISGTFNFDCVDENNQTVKITDGRFDTIY